MTAEAAIFVYFVCIIAGCVLFVTTAAITRRYVGGKSHIFRLACAHINGNDLQSGWIEGRSIGNEQKMDCHHSDSSS
jgi:hypothetical protein